jgi:hypothetical protein
MPSPTNDIENALETAEFLEVAGLDANDPLLPKAESGTKSSSRKSSRYFRRVHETIELDDIPPIIKSANGNIFWADEQCTRRVGLTSTEARLFLRLLQVDEPENFNYEDYKNMFDDFGREEQRLRELIDLLPWWSLETYHQRPIWQARIKWLERMREPRLWLLYLMARRRRILKQAADRVLQRLKEKRELRMMNGGINGNVNGGVNGVHPQVGGVQEPESPARPVMVNEEAQTSEVLLHAKRIRNSIAGKIRSSFGSSHRDSPSRPSTGHCPVFDKPFEATREDIKRQVELLMPNPQPYIVIGWFLRSASDPKERIMEFEKEEHLFKALRHGEGDVRGWRRFFSLRSLKGFGLYKVSHPDT